MEFNVQRFHRQLRYHASRTVPELLEDLGTLRGLDARAEGQLGTLTLFAWMGLVPGAVLCIIAFGVWAGSHEAELELSAEASQLVGVAAVVGGLLLAGGVLMFLWRSRLRARDLDNRRYQLARVLLQRLQVDLPPDAPVRLMLDLRAVDVREKRVREDLVGWWTTRFFVDPWLVLEGRLSDGALLRIAMEQRLQKRERQKTNPRGRTKTKHKTKGFARLEVSLRVKPERYPGLTNLHDRAEAAVRLPRRVTLERLRVRADRLSARVRLAEDWVAREGPLPDDPETPAFYRQALQKDDASRTATMLLLSLYQTLGYARKRARRRAARARVPRSV